MSILASEYFNVSLNQLQMRKIKLLLLGLLCCIQLLWAQNRQVTGKVLDENGVPVVGATIIVRNTNLSAVTSADGSFSINAPANATLQVSYVGYRSIDVPASAAGTIRLAQGENRLTEVVVTGYGQSTKRELTSSITKVKGSEVANVPVP